MIISLSSNVHTSPMQFKSKLAAMRKTDRNAKDIGGNLRDDYTDYYYYDYYYDEEPLPSGPTRRPDTAGKWRKPLRYTASLCITHTFFSRGA